MQLFRRFNDVGVTMVIATHDLALANQIGGRHVALRDGQLLDIAAEAKPVVPERRAERRWLG